MLLHVHFACDERRNFVLQLPLALLVGLHCFEPLELVRIDLRALLALLVRLLDLSELLQKLRAFLFLFLEDLSNVHLLSARHA